MECIPRCTHLLTTCARSLGGKGGTMLIWINRCQKLLSRRCGIWGGIRSKKVCLVVPFFVGTSITIVLGALAHGAWPVAKAKPGSWVDIHAIICAHTCV